MRISNLMSVTDDGGAIFWSCWVKGAARVGCALVIAEQLFVNKIDLTSVAGLRDSMANIYCTLEVASQDYSTISLANAMISFSGSIRQGLDVLQWLGKIHLGRSHGLDGAGQIAKWNRMAPQYAQVNGNNRTCLLNIIVKCNEEHVSMLLGHSRRVDKPCFANDTFANQKLLPGYCEYNN